MGPTIIIGLGGVGSEITALTEDRLRNTPPGFGKELRKLLRFAVVDTDVSALRERQRNGFQGTIVQISDNMTVERYLHYDQGAKEWFPPCQILSRKTLTEGAGQVRAVSRLALGLALQKRDCLSPLYDTIDSLHLVSKLNSEQPTRVVIVCSLAGGTGSGIFLPLAMHLQEYLKQRYRNTEPIFKGFFIMPSFFEPIAAGTELKSLNANGYAAIKELNAFTLMRDRQIKPWQYPYIKIKMVDSHEQMRSYVTSPYDLCFLFEKQNQDDKHLCSFEESKRNVANCVWMQTVNPLLEKNGSLEDNLFKIVSTSSFDKRYNRFAGMGIAHMIYPYKKMEGYFSSVMAHAVVNLEWYAADAAWEQVQRRAREESGSEPHSSNEKLHYINFVEDNDAWKHLADPIRENHWAYSYISAVETLTKNKFDRNPGDVLTNVISNLESLIKNKSTTGWNSERIAWYKDCYGKIRSEQPVNCQNNRRSLLSSLLPEEQQKKNKNQQFEKHQIEYWLDQSGNPVTDRYFIALVLKELEMRRQILVTERDHANKAGGEYPWIIEQMEKKKTAKRVADSAENLSPAVDFLYNWACLELQLAILDDLSRMVENLWDSYKALLQDYTTWIDREKRDLRKNLLDTFETQDGRTTLFVCTSENCLARMEEIVKNSVHTQNYSTLFARELCGEAIRQYQKGLDADSSGLKKFWNDQFVRKAGALLDMDVLSALEKEACWEYELKHHKPLDSGNPQYNSIITNYMEDEAFEKVHQIFVRAFLRIPNIQQRHTMEMCIYPPEIPQNNALLQNILQNHLVNRHGVENTQNDDERKYRIDFYRAVFGVSAGEVSAFLFEPENSPIPSGDAHNDYETMVSSLDWQNQRQNFLTPHTDWRWHKVAAMPELSAKYGRKRTVDLLLGVLYGLLSQKIKIEEDKDSKQTIYRIGKLGEQAFDLLDQRITDLYQLVDFVDESPAITTALLKEMEQNKEELTGQIAAKDNLELEPRGNKYTADMVMGYCCKKLSLEASSKDEIAEIMAEVLRRLTHTAVKTSFRREYAAAKEMEAIIREMTSRWKDAAGINLQMQEHLTLDRINQWLETKNSDTT